MRRNVAALQYNRSFCYLTKNDFESAFGEENTVLVAKHFRTIKLNSERESVQESEPQLNNSFRNTSLVVTGDVLRPVDLKMVNMEAKQNCDSNLFFCLDDMESDEDRENGKQTVVLKSPKKQRKIPERCQNLALFRRVNTSKKFLELEEEERENLASIVLENDRFKNKSMFHYIQEKQLVQSGDYEEPDFISLEQPTDAAYENNYSSEAPSVYDLFDLNVDMLEMEENYEFTQDDYEMVEYIEDDEDL